MRSSAFDTLTPADPSGKSLAGCRRALKTGGFTISSDVTTSVLLELTLGAPEQLSPPKQDRNSLS